MARSDSGKRDAPSRTRHTPSTPASDAGPSAEVSSPACYAHEAADGYMGFLDRGELVEQLNVLLEAERAGAQVGAHLETDADDPELKTLARVIRADEARWCRMLIGALKALDAEPSQAVGAFFGKAMAISDIEARIAFVNRGQGWVVRKLAEMLPQIRDNGLQANLRAMLVAHVQNIETATATLSRRAAANPPDGAPPSKPEFWKEPQP
jgi:hypothetical protein